jgi:anti-anti-sigma factor
VAAELTVAVERQGDAVIARLRGEIDVTSVGEVRDAIEPFLAPSQTVVLDLNEVSFLDSSLLNVLVQARGEMSKTGGQLYLRNPSEQARKLLTLAELDDLLQDEMDRQNNPRG